MESGSEKASFVSVRTLGMQGVPARPFRARPAWGVETSIYLVPRSHQKDPEGPDSGCNDAIHSVIQGEAQQEEETSIQQET